MNGIGNTDVVRMSLNARKMGPYRTWDVSKSTRSDKK